MAKGQKRGNREVKKPKSAVKTASPSAAPSFLRPGPTGPGSPPANGPGFRSGKR
jgi:hypothetical protein